MTMSQIKDYKSKARKVFLLCLDLWNVAKYTCYCFRTKVKLISLLPNSTQAGVQRTGDIYISPRYPAAYLQRNKGTSLSVCADQ